MDYQILRFAPKIRDKTKIVVLCAIDPNLSRLVRPLCSTTFMGPTVCLVQNERAVSRVAGRRIPAKKGPIDRSAMLFLVRYGVDFASPFTYT